MDKNCNAVISLDFKEYSNLKYENNKLSLLKTRYQSEKEIYKIRIDEAIKILKDTNVNMPSTLLMETIDYSIHILQGKVNK